MDIIDTRTGNMSYTSVTTNNITDMFYVTGRKLVYGNPLIKDFNNYKWTYNIELYSTEIILYLCVDIETIKDNKKDILRIGGKHCISLNTLYNIRLSKYNICRDMLDKLYKEIYTKYNILEIPEKQKIEFDNKIIYDYIDIWHSTMK